MYAKYFHGDMAFQTKVVFLGLPVYNSVDRKELSRKRAYQNDSSDTQIKRDRQSIFCQTTARRSDTVPDGTY